MFNVIWPDSKSHGTIPPAGSMMVVAQVVSIPSGTSKTGVPFAGFDKVVGDIAGVSRVGGWGGSIGNIVWHNTTKTLHITNVTHSDTARDFVVFNICDPQQNPNKY